MKQTQFSPQFVDVMPEDLEAGKVYISVRFRTASHLCACGCGDKVVTPIKPPKWAFTYDGETISLWPSIGRWQLPCQSHYIIRRNKVIWARAFTEKEMELVKRRDARDLHDFYRTRRGTDSEEPEEGGSDPRT